MQRGARVGTIVLRTGIALGGRSFSLVPFLLLSFGRVAHGSDAERSCKGESRGGETRTGLKPEQLQHESPFAPFSSVTREKRTPDASPSSPSGSDPPPSHRPARISISAAVSLAEGFCPICTSVTKVRHDSFQLLSSLRGEKQSVRRDELQPSWRLVFGKYSVSARGG